MTSVTPRRRAALLALVCLPLPLSAAPERKPWPARTPVPPLVLPLLDGGTWRLADARGRLLVLNFWASWCEPCRAELPSLELLAARHEAQGLQVVTVNFRETEGTMRRFLAQMPIGLLLARDVDGSAAKAFGVRLFPSTFVIGRDGRPLFWVAGEVDWGADPARGWVAAALSSS
ncbi:MAG: TlpA disulfide reductase family protein [Rubrivivax sp.]